MSESPAGLKIPFSYPNSLTPHIPVKQSQDDVHIAPAGSSPGCQELKALLCRTRRECYMGTGHCRAHAGPSRRQACHHKAEQRCILRIRMHHSSSCGLVLVYSSQSLCHSSQSADRHCRGLDTTPRRCFAPMHAQSPGLGAQSSLILHRICSHLGEWICRWLRMGVWHLHPTLAAAPSVHRSDLYILGLAMQFQLLPKLLPTL